MLHIVAKSTNHAWTEAFKLIYSQGAATGNDFYLRDEPVVFEINEPALDPPHPLFPMASAELQTINDFIWSGNNEEEVSHEWTKLYHHRLFDEPNAQIPYMIRKLREGHLTGEIQASLWDKTQDQDVEISPCTQVVWCRKKHEKLETHVHAHSSDAYKKLLMNLQEFMSLHLFIAKEAKIEAGRYIHFIDSCHIHCEDEVSASLLFENLKEH